MKIKKDSRQKLRGSVLFTVVAVMMVIIVFVMSALAIAGATSRRAYSDFAKSQAQYTARSALDATVTYLRDYDKIPDGVDALGAPKFKYKNNELGQKVTSLKKSDGKIELDVDFLDSASVNDAAMGAAKVIIECIAEDYDYYDGKKHSVVAITAVVTLAGETSEESVMLLKDPPSSGGGGGANAVTSLASSSSDTAPFILGGSSVNLLGTSTQPTEWNNSNGIFNGTATINSDLKIMNLEKILLNKGEGIAVFGNLFFDGPSNNFKIQSIANSADIASYKDVPYLFVDGTMNITKGGGPFLNVEWGSPDKGINIYCRNTIYKTQNGGGRYADIYMYGTDPIPDIDALKNSDSYIDTYYNYTDITDSWITDSEGHDIPGTGYLSIIGYNGTTNLLEWANKTLNGTPNSTCGGNIISNGSIKFEGFSKMDGDVTVRQGVRIVTTDQGGVEIKKNLTVGGLLIIDDYQNRTPSCDSLSVTSLDNVLLRSGKFKVGSEEFEALGKDGANYRVRYNGAEYDNFKDAYEAAFGSYTPISDVNYPKEMTYEELVGLTEERDYPHASLNNDADGDGVGDNKLLDTPTAAHGKFVWYEADGSLTYSAKYFRTWDDVKDMFVGADGVTPVVTVYDNSFDRSSEINSTCILKGTFGNNGKDLVFNIAKGKEIWVYLDNFETQASGPDIIVKGGGTLRMFSKTDIILRKTNIMTEHYKNKLNAGGPLLFYQTPDPNTDIDEIPTIYLYMDYKNTDPGFKIQGSDGGTIITGYIFAPTAKFDMMATGGNKNIKYQYEDGTIIDQSGDVAVIGSAFVNEFSCANTKLVVFVSDEKLGSNPPGDEATSWAVFNYMPGSGLN